MEDNKIVIQTGDHTLTVTLNGTVAEVHCTGRNCPQPEFQIRANEQPVPLSAPPIQGIGATRDKDGNIALHLHFDNA